MLGGLEIVSNIDQNNNEVNKNDEKKQNKKEENEGWISSILIAVVVAVVIRIFIFAPTVVVGQSMEPTLNDLINYKMSDNDRLIAERVSYFLNIKPSRGNIVTFTEPSSEFYIESNPLEKVIKFFGKKDYIKRVIGVEGDHIQFKSDTLRVDERDQYTNYDIKGNKIYVEGKLLEGNHEIRLENASVYINGKRLVEPYTNGPWDIRSIVLDGQITPNRTQGYDINLDVTVPKGYIYVMGDNRNNSNDSRKFSPDRNDYLTKDGCISLKEMSGRVIFRFWPIDRIGTIKN